MGQRSSKTDETATSLQEFTDELQRVATDNGMSKAQVLLKWALQHGYGTLPKSTSPERTAENISVLKLPDLPAAALSALDSHDQNRPFAWPAGDPCAYDK